MTSKALARQCFFFFLPIFSLQAGSWYEQKLQGWYYFEEVKEDDKVKKELSPEDAHTYLEEKKIELKHLLSLAIVAPTPQNIERYMHVQKLLLKQSALFAEGWGKVLLANPSLGDFLENPTSSYGILAKKALEQQQTAEFLEKYSDKYFLLFFFKGKDPLSSLAYEVVKLFGSLHRWKVKAVSLDGISVPGIPDFKIDAGIGEKMHVKDAPSLFAVNPVSKKAFPVGAGMISVTEIEKNIRIQLTSETDHD